MESIYVSVILLLLGVITGGAMVVGMLQGQQNRWQARRYHPEDLAIAMANTSARRNGMDSWRFLLFLIVLMVVLSFNRGNWTWMKGHTTPQSPTRDSLAAVSIQALPAQTMSIELGQTPSSSKAEAPVSGWYVQVGAFSSRDAAAQVLASWQNHTRLDGRVLPSAQVPAVYKVGMGPFARKAMAQKWVAEWGTGFVVEWE